MRKPMLPRSWRICCDEMQVFFTLTLGMSRTNVRFQRYPMLYIQLPANQDAKGFLLLAKSGFSVVCLPENTYGVRVEHLKLLKSKRIRFKRLEPGKIPIPKPALAI